ncbi:NTP transferase domain-containing protein [Spirosoma taeanense]|uniref:NTP transferase domain-containing protein n=1 Tax=Spirosoma taeanense TaxID=2735870 RepID=A0A6M5YG41_9BACT|nr:NTP transferase domain-containing protein [Spirosoma taeanense]
MLNGLILTGGRSSRMGADKSRLTYHDKPQREFLADLLRPYCEKVFWSVNAEQAAELTGIGQPFIVDAFEVEGPLNGLLSAFQHDPTVAWLVVACDMPLLTSRSLDGLVAARMPTRPATAFYDSDGRYPEPLLSIWEPQSRALLQQALDEGNPSPRKILLMNDAALLTAPDVQELTNVNDPASRSALGF